MAPDEGQSYNKRKNSHRGVLTCAACSQRPQLAPETDLRAEIEAMREAIAQRVPDTQRAAELNRALDRYETELLSFGTMFAAIRFNRQALNSRPDGRAPSAYKKVESETLKELKIHDATVEEFRTLPQRVDAINTSTNETLLDLRCALRSALGRPMAPALSATTAGKRLTRQPG